jgi:hypothetical protein
MYKKWKYITFRAEILILARIFQKNNFTFHNLVLCTVSSVFSKNKPVKDVEE